MYKRPVEHLVVKWKMKISEAGGKILTLDTVSSKF